VIHQGDVYWVSLRPPVGSEPGFRHPLVVVQNNLFNRSRIGTVIACAITSNLARAHAPGNVLLRKGEANLPRRSVVNISQLVTIDKGALDQKIGSLSPHRVREILDGIGFILVPTD